jgi:glycosyltransferase involved in cell wall biosynthesis
MVPHHDQDAGSQRMHALLRILVDLGHRVTFLPDNLAGLEPYTSGLQQLGVEVLYGRMSEIAFLDTHGSTFDVAILCRAHFAAKYLPTLLASRPRPFIIFDTVDLHFLREQRFAELEQDAGLARAAERTRALEMGVMRSSDMVWVTSTHEAELLRGDAVGPKVEVVPMIHTVRADVPPFGSRRNILFIGGFRHPPNEDAVIYFVEQVLPLVRPALPGVQFLIVGSHVPPRILALASADVIILGYVQDVEPVFDACRLSVAPIRYGAGVKGKVTQSLAWGLPAVATPVAVEGSQMVDGAHLMIASDPASFARRVVEVYENEELWTRLSVDGRRQVEACLSYDSIRTAVDTMLRQASSVVRQGG